MIQVTFDIPERLLGDFYLEVGDALQRAQEGDDPGEAEPEPEDWDTGPYDDDLAKTVWRQCSPRAQAVFSLLMDNPGVAMSADDIASKIGLANGRHGLAGVVAWPSRHCEEVGRTPLFQYESGPGDTSSYWMDAGTAALFVAARAAYPAKLGRPPRD
jgi:hypothetical protein